ncbi:MAG: hypothetical protein ACRD6X_12015 [Pyrinomonadaceae bacterium]|uniref:hypothetical protein n=1 Tax=Pseudomonas sp. TaxID=306 RepID=UPI003D6E7ED8
MQQVKGYTGDQVAAIIAEYKQSGKPITVFCKDRGHKPAYQTLKGWLDLAGVHSGPKATVSNAGSTIAPTDFKAMKEVFEQQKKAYADNLNGVIDGLKAKIADLQKDLAAAEAELEEFTK